MHGDFFGVKADRQYIIAFKGLKNGAHQFDFEIDKSFFTALEYSEVSAGKLSARVDLEKKTNLMELGVSIEGKVTVACDRCLDEFEQEIDYFGHLYYKVASGVSEDDEVIFLNENDFEIDLMHYFYESIVLSLPMPRVHPEDETGQSGCNPEMLKRINRTPQKSKEEKASDPRWDKLKEWFNK